MPPHCDKMDGPVVTAAEMALEMENINYILPYVSKGDEEELRDAFERSSAVRELGSEAAELADYWFFETAVRLHLKSRGHPYTGIKPSDVALGPALSMAQDAVLNENSHELVRFMISFMEEDIQARFDDVMSRKDYDINDVESARDYVNSMLDFVQYLDKLYEFMENG